VRDDLDQMFMDATATENLLLEPVQKLITSNESVAAIWPHLPARLQKRASGRWRRDKEATLASLRTEAIALGHDIAGFDAALDQLFAPPKTKRKTAPPSREELLAEKISIRRDLAKISGRAPFARPLLVQAFNEVMAGLHPREEGGCLFETPDLRRTRETRMLDRQTNNHLIRHRLMILGGDRRHCNPKKWKPGLIDDIISEFAGGDPTRVERITVEVNREVREMSGLTAQDIAKEMNERLRSHGKVSQRLADKLPSGTRIGGSLIRKGRIADDLSWRCPYTGVEFEPADLINKRVDKDHVIPRSQRASDSLDSLVITFAAVNKWKGQRTALQFINEFGGKSVPDAPHLALMTPARFREFVEKLDTRGHPDDAKRKKRRKELLQLERYEEKSGGFTPGQLTQTSQLARLAAQVLRGPFEKLSSLPQFVALPGFVTGYVRRNWNLLGCLSVAAPGVLEESGELKSKTDIRNVTHLHHALDACVLALAARRLRRDVWTLLSERRLTQAQRNELMDAGIFEFDAQGYFRLRELPDELTSQIRTRLAERRVVQHIPADMSGLRIEENTRGIVRRENGRVFLRQRKKNAEGKIVVNETNEPEGKVIGLPALGSGSGKLATLKGVRVIAENFGVAILDDTTLRPAERFVVIPHERVWRRLDELRGRNGGKSRWC
jgi:CRISPR-associated endonuclease Csn1